MKHVHKEYQRQFLLEPTKLTRLVAKIHERLADHRAAASHDSFEVFLAGGRREELTTLDQVLSLDNSRRHKIERIVLACSASTPGAARPEHEVQVDFARPKGQTNRTQVIAVSVRSDAPGWASRTLSEVEEQVERTWLPARPLLVLLGLLLVVLIVLASQFLTFSFPPGVWWLTSTDLDRVEEMIQQHPRLTDEDLREVSTMQLRNLIEARRAPRSLSPAEMRHRLHLAVPLLVVLFCLLILLVTCYPGTVFLWGDEVDRYANTLQRRKTVWGIILAVVVVGVLSRFFFEGVSSWLPRP